MASYLHIHDLAIGDNQLKQRIMVALKKHEQYLRSLAGNATQAQQTWASGLQARLETVADDVLWEVAVQPAVADAVSSSGVTDETLQAIVDACCERY